MGNRYGRNQKRRARADIARLSANERELVARLSESYGARKFLENSLREWDNEIRMLLGEYSAFRKFPPNHAVNKFLNQAVRIPVQRRCARVGSRETEMHAMESACFAVSELRQLVIDDHIAEVQLQQLIRAYFVDGNGSRALALGYTIDGTQFLSSMLGEREYSIIAGEIASALMRAWGCKGRGGAIRGEKLSA